MTTEFITVDLAHRDCEECASCVEGARIHAAVTGSIGATYSETPGEHSATVRRPEWVAAYVAERKAEEVAPTKPIAPYDVHDFERSEFSEIICALCGCSAGATHHL